MLKKSNLIVIILLLCGCVSKHDEIDNSVPEIFYPAFMAFVDSDGRDVLDVVNMTLLRSEEGVDEEGNAVRADYYSLGQDSSCEYYLDGVRMKPECSVLEYVKTTDSNLGYLFLMIVDIMDPETYGKNEIMTFEYRFSIPFIRDGQEQTLILESRPQYFNSSAFDIERAYFNGKLIEKNGRYDLPQFRPGYRHFFVIPNMQQ